MPRIKGKTPVDISNLFKFRKSPSKILKILKINKNFGAKINIVTNYKFLKYKIVGK